jgi:NAD(P)-dependent dehydrogenase (short-subunit alcohol dehydrogenase family)
MPRYDVAGRTVLITGSAGGLGVALADALRARGANLALLDLDANAIGAQAQALGGVTVARAWRADVRDFDSLQRATAEAAAHFGRIDVVIANAGIDTVAPMAAIDPADFDRVIDINLNGVWRTFRAAISHVQEHRGYLLAISSMAAFVHSPLQAPYAASKAGVWAMCDSIRLELRHLGVSVGSVHPTFFHTPMFDELGADRAGRVLWGGNEKGLWKMVDRETVIANIVAGIERRADIIVIPRVNTLVARAPGLFRKFVDRVGFPGDTIARATELASAAGWHDTAARERTVGTTTPATDSEQPDLRMP